MNAQNPSRLCTPSGICGQLEQSPWLMPWHQLLKLDSGELLGNRLDRNLNQSSGGADCISLPGFAIEVKRQEKLAIAAWW